MSLGLFLWALRPDRNTQGIDRVLRLLVRRSLQTEKKLSDLRSKRIEELIKLVSQDQSSSQKASPLEGPANRPIRADYDR
jgi:hypothetical protein